MSTKNKKPYVVRGFNTTTEGSIVPGRNGNSADFDCTGVMTKFGSFTEVTVDKQHEAVVEMSTNSALQTMSTRNLIKSNPNAYVTDFDQAKELYVVDLIFVTNADRVDDLRSYRSELRETLKTWAEKSRVRGRRGWRASAIKTPTFEFDKKLDTVVIRTQLILSTTIFYDDHTTTINVNFDRTMENEDLRNLHKAVGRFMGGMYNYLKYKHSEIGEGEIV